RLMKLMKGAERIGWFVVVIGVAGEGAFEGLGSVSDGQLQTFDSALLADAQRKTAVANERAGIAEQGAALATATAKGFESKIADDDARVKVAEAQVSTAMAASADAVAKIAAADARSAEASTKAEAFRADIAKANEAAAQAR